MGKVALSQNRDSLKRDRPDPNREEARGEGSCGKGSCQKDRMTREGQEAKQLADTLGPDRPPLRCPYHLPPAGQGPQTAPGSSEGARVKNPCPCAEREP